tara:strand:+ start:3045 stop:3758 length:714 start_codon:yes stop_codon:yes gene_type:complete
MSLAKLDYFHYIISGTTYIFSGGYSLIASLGNLLKRPNDDELVLNGLNNLYLVREEVTQREQKMRESVQIYLNKAKEFMKNNMKREARVMVRLHMLYDMQVNHCQSTMTAIESHIISLESLSLNKKVCLALKSSNYVNGFETIDENVLEDAVEKLDDRNVSTSEFLKALGDIPSLDIDDSMIDDKLSSLAQDIESVPVIEKTETNDVKPTISLINLPEVPTKIPVLEKQEEKIESLA